MTRLIQRHVAGQGAKIGVAQLESHGAGEQAVVAQAPAYELGEVTQRALELFRRGRIDVKRGLVADRFGLFLIGVGARVFAARLQVQPLAIPAEMLLQALKAPLLEVADG